MTTSILRVEHVRRGELDAVLWELRSARLERRPEGMFVECDDEPAGAMPRILRAGMRARPSGPAPGRAGLVAAVVGDLEPRAAAGIVDRISIRALDAGEATLRLRRSRFAGWRRGRYPRERVRDLLHDEERMYGWTRHIWASASVFRSGALRGVRPIVFDRGALERGVERYAFVRDGLVARWIAA